MQSCPQCHPETKVQPEDWTSDRPVSLEVRIRSILQQLRAPAAKQAQIASGGLAPWQVRKVCSYLDERLGEKVRIGALADLVALSPNHFCTAFRRSTGEPPYRYLLRRRLDRAQALLWVKDDLSITEVALAVGFGSSAHFSTIFKKEVGISPSEWKNRRP